MRTLNEVRLMGNIGADPIVRQSGDTLVVKLSLATNGFNPRTGEVTAPQWHRVTLFDDLARYARQEVRKGMRVEIEGRLKYTTYPHPQHAEIEMHGSEIIAHRLWVIARPQNAPERNGGEAQPEPQQSGDGPPTKRQQVIDALAGMAAGVKALGAIVTDGSDSDEDLPF